MASKPAQDGNMTDRLTKMRISYPLHYRLIPHLPSRIPFKKKKKKRFIETGADCCRSNKHSVTRQPPVHKPLLVKAPKPKTQAVITSPHPLSLTMLSQLLSNSFLCCAMRCLEDTYCLKYSVKTLNLHSVHCVYLFISKSTAHTKEQIKVRVKDR